MNCTWESRNCDGTVELHIYRDQEIPLCRFHGQAHPKVGEDDAQAKKRTKRARELLTYRGRRDDKEQPFVGAVIPGRHYGET